MGHSDRLKRLSTVLFPALFAPSQLFVLGPLTVYSANRSEFIVSFLPLVTEWLPFLLIAVAVLVAVGLVIPQRLLAHYIAGLFALGLLLWIQGNLLIADYGPLYGEGLNLEDHAWRGKYEIAMWVVVLGTSMVFATSVVRVASFSSQLLIGLQTVALVLPTLSTSADHGNTDPEWQRPPDEVYRLSDRQNVIHIVLDGFHSRAFEEASAEDPVTFDRDFAGFIFFADHLGAFPTTRASMPAMLTGAAYRNDVPLGDFVQTANEEHSVFRTLAGEGFDLHSVTFHRFDHPDESVLEGQDAVLYTIPTPYGSYRDYVEFTAAQLLDLSLFRHVPHGTKDFVYNDNVWLIQRVYAERRPADQATRGSRPSSQAAFLTEFTRRLTVSGSDPLYAFIHLAIPHPPVVVSEDCSFVGPRRTTWRNYTGQARCSLAIVADLLNRLRELGVYDSSAILLTSDHGWRFRRGAGSSFRGISTPAGNLGRLVPSARALLAVKSPGSTGPLQTSYAPTSITDIPASIYDLAGVEADGALGESVLRIDPDVGRQRTYAFHSWRNADWARPYFDALHLFSVEGRSTDPESWTYERAIVDPTARVDGPLGPLDQ